MNPDLSRRLGFVLLAFFLGLPLSAQPFHSSYFMGDPDNEIASARRASDGGFFGAGHFEGLGTIFKLRASGAVDWARAYGPIRPVAIRPARGGGFAWIGNVPDAEHPVPVFVLSDSLGIVRRTVRFTIPNTLRAEVRALETDTRDGSFWVGGNAWLGAEVQEPWLARLDSEGGLRAINAFPPPMEPPFGPSSLRIEALVPTASPGVLAVGRWVYDDDVPWGAGKNKLFALRVNVFGTLTWARAYHEKVTRARSEQWMVAVARDPRSTLPVAYAVAQVDKICGVDRSALPCFEEFAGATVLAIDENTGDVNASVFLGPQKHTTTFVPTAIARDDGNNVIAVGGSLDLGTAGSRESILIRAQVEPTRTVIGTQTYGDGSGPFTSEVADLSSFGIPDAPAVEPGFVLANRQSRPGVDRPVIVTTDAMGHSDGTCDREIDMFSNPSIVSKIDLPLKEVPGSTESYTLSPSNETLTGLPCSRIR